MPVANKSTIYDVFVTHATVDKPIADVVTAQLESSGLSVATASRLKLQQPRILLDLVRDTIAECNAVVAIIGPQSVHNPNVMFEFGAAFAWNKACFLVVNGINYASLPASLAAVRKYTLAEIDRVTTDILDSRQELNEEDVTTLARIYQSNRTPVDALFSKPAQLSRITREFNGDRGRALSPEIILQHLMRLRKQSKLPKLRSS